jgi:hypothetical protein
VNPDKTTFPKGTVKVTSPVGVNPLRAMLPNGTVISEADILGEFPDKVIDPKGTVIVTGVAWIILLDKWSTNVFPRWSIILKVIKIPSL